MVGKTNGLLPPTTSLLHPRARRTGAPSHPHVPPNPTVTWPFSTITGTSRPPEIATIRSSSFAFAFTLTY